MAGLGGLLGSGLGLIGSFTNANQQRHFADELHSEGDPYRSSLRAMTADPSLYFKGPIAQELARQADSRYSSVFGNPAGSGTAQALSLQAMLNGYGQERDRLFRMGGGEAMNNAYPGARMGQNKAYGGIFGAGQDLLGSIFGGGLGSLFGGGMTSSQIGGPDGGAGLG